MFGADKEGKKKHSSGHQSQGSGNQPDQPKTEAQIAKEARKFRGKRNSIGAKMAKFRGGGRKFQMKG